jgi:hypothetical protein
MNPAFLRAAVLAIELVVFFLVSAFTSYFLSHAAAWQRGQDDKPPARFPVTLQRPSCCPSGARPCR